MWGVQWVWQRMGGRLGVHPSGMIWLVALLRLQRAVGGGLVCLGGAAGSSGLRWCEGKWVASPEEWVVGRIGVCLWELGGVLN